MSCTISTDLFQEEKGSPKETIGDGGFSAIRTFRVPWARRQEAEVILLGDGLSFGGASAAVGYPDRPGVVCEGITIEPQPGITPSSPAQFTDISSQLNEYDKYAIIKATYKTIETPDVPDLPEVPEGYLDYSESYGKEAIFLPNSTIRFASATNKIPKEAGDQFIVFQYVAELTYTWTNVSNPLNETTRKLTGHVNNAEFLGAEIGTLLYEGTRKRKRFYYNPDPNTATQYWTLAHTFRYKKVVNENGVFVGGWNYIYSQEDEAWQEIQLNNGGKPYPESDLNPLFNLPPAAPAAP